MTAARSGIGSISANRPAASSTAGARLSFSAATSIAYNASGWSHARRMFSGKTCSTHSFRGIFTSCPRSSYIVITSSSAIGSFSKAALAQGALLHPTPQRS